LKVFKKIRFRLEPGTGEISPKLLGDPSPFEIASQQFVEKELEIDELSIEYKYF
jgi:hypothetical protein